MQRRFASLLFATALLGSMGSAHAQTPSPTFRSSGATTVSSPSVSTSRMNDASMVEQSANDELLSQSALLHVQMLQQFMRLNAEIITPAMQRQMKHEPAARRQAIEAKMNEVQALMGARAVGQSTVNALSQGSQDNTTLTQALVQNNQIDAAIVIAMADLVDLVHQRTADLKRQALPSKG